MMVLLMEVGRDYIGTIETRRSALEAYTCPGGGQVAEPGTAVGTVAPSVASRFGLDPSCRVVAGTTDSIA
jgi:sugar (pentulose or hexulose) kinase